MTERTAASWTAWVFSGLAAIFSSACLAEEAKPQGRPVSAFDQTVPAAPVARSDKAAASEPSDPGTAPARRRPSETSNSDDKARIWKGLSRLHNYDDERRRGNPYATEESRRRRAGGAHEAQRRGPRRPGR